MSVSDNYSPDKSSGDGSTVEFTGSWKVFNSSFMEVYFEDKTTGVQTLKTLDTDYELTFDSTGYVVDFTISSPPPNTVNVIRARNIAKTQNVPFRTSKGFQGDVTEDAFDKITAIAQDIFSETSRMPRFALGSSLSQVIIATPVDRRTVVWDSATETFIMSEYDPDEQSGAAAASAAAAAASASAASTSAGNASTSAGAAAASAVAAAASVAAANLPPSLSGQAGKLLQVNLAADGYDLISEITEDLIEDDAVTLEKMAAGTAGNLISYDASGDPVAVGTGTVGQVLKSAGAGLPPSFQNESSAFGQVVQTVDVTNRSTSSSSIADTGVQVIVTPTSASSKVLVTVQGILGNADGASGRVVYMTIDRNGTNLGPAGVDGNFSFIVPGGTGVTYAFSFSFLDSPSTTSAVTYKFRWQLSTGGVTIYLGRRGADTAVDCPTIITAQETS
jgi:hypothetical protein